MTKKHRSLQLTSQEEGLLNLSDMEVEALLADAKGGIVAHRNKLLGWVYIRARNYYYFKAPKATSEGDELAGTLLLHFERRIDQIQTAVGWTQFMLANTHRWIKPKKRLVYFVENTILEKYDTRSPAPLNLDDLDDKQLAQYRIMMNIRENESEATRLILRYHFADPPMTYEVIAERMNMNPSAVRKRVQRFYDKVKKAWKNMDREVTET